jgi:hypothetical protein
VLDVNQRKVLLPVDDQVNQKVGPMELAGW